MSRDDISQPQPPEALAQPRLSLLGDVDKASVGRLIDQLREAEKGEGDIVLELTTEGGDAELARRLVLEIAAVRARLRGRQLLFLGKTAVYSAGATIMAGFPREDRWFTPDTMLMIHCRKLERTIEISGPIRASLPELRAIEHQIETGVKLEDENFRRLIEGSEVPFAEIVEKAPCNWYLDAEEALRRGLIAGIWSPV